MALTVTLALGGCRSKQPATPPAQPTVPAAEQTAQPWTNVYLPMKVEILSPRQFSLSGRATMVRGSSIYVSMRVFGFEVGSAYVDSSMAYVTLKQPERLCIEQPVAELMRRHGITITQLQDAMLGSPDALASLPKSVKWSLDSSDSEAVLTLAATVGGKQLAVRLTSQLRSAQWNQESVRQWSAPGSDYRRLSPESLTKLLQTF